MALWWAVSGLLAGGAHLCMWQGSVGAEMVLGESQLKASWLVWQLTGACSLFHAVGYRSGVPSSCNTAGCRVVGAAAVGVAPPLPVLQ
jgi:hypothetical protein